MTAERAELVPAQVKGTVLTVRRVFSIHEVRPDHGGTVEFVFAVTGPGTRWLSERRTRDTLDVAGPLGRPFPVPRDPVNALLVGGGYGSAPLFALGGKLRARGCQVDYLLGAASADRVFGALTARRSGRSAVITTEDGSLGARGQVTDLLTQVIHEARTDVIYACGPMGMLRAVTALAGRDDIGTIPFDALGAPGWKPRPQAGPSAKPPARPQPGGRQPGRQASGRAQPGRSRAGPATGPAAGRSGHGR